jgi:DNA replication protein DnaC
MTTEPQPDEIERVAAFCETCEQPFKAAVMRSPFNPSKVLFTQRHCDPCCNSEVERRSKAEAEADRKARAAERDAHWQRVCPMEFRTLEEGGRTDLARLLREQKHAREIMEHPLTGQGLVARGDSGTGKTRAVWRLLRRFHDAGRYVRALTSGEFDRQARDAGGRFTLTEWVERMVETDVLFIDDLGKAPWTPATVGLFFDVLDERYRAGRSMFLTTNLSGQKLVTQLRIGKDIGDPMLRRIRETCKVIVTSQEHEESTTTNRD